MTIIRYHQSFVLVDQTKLDIKEQGHVKQLQFTVQDGIDHFLPACRHVVTHVPRDLQAMPNMGLPAAQAMAAAGASPATGTREMCQSTKISNAKH